MFNNNIKRDWGPDNLEPYLFNQETAKEQLEFLNDTLRELELSIPVKESTFNVKNKEYARLAKKSQKDPVNKIKLKHLKKEIAQLNSDVDKTRNRIENLKERILFLEKDLQTDCLLEQNGYFGRSMLGRAISAVAQIAAIPVTLGIELATRHPFVAACVVLGIQVYGATAATVLEGRQNNATREQMVNTASINATASFRLSPYARFNRVKQACESEGLSVECSGRMIRLIGSTDPQQAKNATEFLKENVQVLFEACEKEALVLEQAKATLNIAKPKPPIPEPNKCEATKYNHGYMKLDECIRTNLRKDPNTLDNKCDLRNYCEDVIKLTFVRESRVLTKGQSAPCYKKGVYKQDIIYENANNPKERIVRATVKTAFSGVTCNLDGVYKADDTILSRVEPALHPKPVATSKPDSALVAQLKADCKTLSSIECAKRVAQAFHSHNADNDLSAHITKSYDSLMTPVTQEIEKLEAQKSFLDENFTPFPFPLIEPQCDKAAADFSKDCIDGMAKLSLSKNSLQADKANQFIAKNKEKFAKGVEQRIDKLKANIVDIGECRPKPAKPNPPTACESTKHEFGRYVLLEDCVEVKLKPNPRPDENECVYINNCADEIKITHNGVQHRLNSSEEVPCFESGSYTLGGKTKKIFAAAFCKNNGNYESNQAVISRVGLAATAAPTAILINATARLEELKRDCNLQTPLACAESTVRLIEETKIAPEVCQHVRDNLILIRSPIKNKIKDLTKFKQENKALFVTSMKLGKCESAKPYTSLDDCVQPVFACDELGDNACELVNNCPEDLILTKGWRSRDLPSGQRVPCFSTGTYTDLDGKGELTEYKKFAGVYCSTTGEEDDPDNADKVYVSKMNT